MESVNKCGWGGGVGSKKCLYNGSIIGVANIGNDNPLWLEYVMNKLVLWSKANMVRTHSAISYCHKSIQRKGGES